MLEIREPAEFPIRPEEYPTIEELTRIIESNPDPDTRDDLFYSSLLGIGIVAVNPSRMILDGAEEL